MPIKLILHRNWQALSASKIYIKEKRNPFQELTANQIDNCAIKFNFKKHEIEIFPVIDRK